MPCPRVPRPADGQRMKERGRTVLLVGTERVQKPRQDTPGEAEDAPAPQPVSGGQDWEEDAHGAKTHRNCGGPVRTSRGLPRMHCPRCGSEWLRQGGAWKRV